MENGRGPLKPKRRKVLEKHARFSVPWKLNSTDFEKSWVSHFSTLFKPPLYCTLTPQISISIFRKLRGRVGKDEITERWKQRGSLRGMPARHEPPVQPRSL